MLVSVIIPAYNASRFIRETLRSAMSQTHRDMEIVVVDDGSTDNTVEIVEELQRQDPRILLLRQPNGGASVARNKGINASKGELIALLDADDLWHPTKIEKQHDLMMRLPNDVGMVYTFFRMIDVNGKIQGNTGSAVYRSGNAFHDLLLYNYIGNGSTPMVRRACLPTPNAFDPTQKGNEDTFFYFHMANKYKVDCVPEYLVGYRWNTGQNNSFNITQQIETHAVMVNKMLELFPDIPPHILKWNECSFYLSYAQTYFKRGNYKPALKFFLTKVATTPSYFLTYPFRRMIGLGARWAGRKLLRVKSEHRFYLEVPTHA